MVEYEKTAGRALAVAGLQARSVDRRIEHQSRQMLSGDEYWADVHGNQCKLWG